MNLNPLENPKKPPYSEEEALEEAERMQNIVEANKGEKTYADAAAWLKKINYEARPFDKKKFNEAQDILYKIFYYEYEDVSEEERHAEIEELLPQVLEKKDIFIEAYEYQPGVLYDIIRMASGDIQGGGIRQRERMEEMGREVIAALLPQIAEDLKKGSSNAWLMQAILLFTESPDGEQEKLGINTLVSLLDVIEERFSEEGNKHKFLKSLELIHDKGTRVQELKVAETIVKLAKKNKNEPECGKLASILLKSYYTEARGFELVNSILERYNLPSEIIELWKKSGPKIDEIVQKNLTAIIMLEKGLSLLEKGKSLLEKSESGASQFLYKEFGIADFGRYPTDLLLCQIEEADSLEHDYGVIFYPRDDYSGVYYNPFILDELHKKCQGKFSLRVFECDGKIGIARALIKLSRKYNPPNQKGHKISLAIIRGHGTEDSIQFGGYDRKNNLYAEDLKGKGAQRAGEFFDENPTIIISSCSTGADQGIAHKLAETMGAKVIAPSVETSLKEINVGKRPGRKFRFNAEYYEKGDKNSKEVKKVYKGKNIS